MSNVAIKFSHAGPSQGALPLAGRGRRISWRPSKDQEGGGNNVKQQQKPYCCAHRACQLMADENESPKVVALREDVITLRGWEKKKMSIQLLPAYSFNQTPHQEGEFLNGKLGIFGFC